MGASLVELMVVVSVAATCLGLAVPALLTTCDDWVMRQATYYLVSQMMRARSDAARHGAAIGLHFIDEPHGARIDRYVDGDVDGIRQSDITSEIDIPMGASVVLGDHYPAVRFELAGSVAPVTATTSDSNSDGVRFGNSDILSFGPVGTATSGTLYLNGPRHQQYAIGFLAPLVGYACCATTRPRIAGTSDLGPNYPGHLSGTPVSRDVG